MADNPLVEWGQPSDVGAQGLAGWRIESALQLAQGLPVHFAWLVAQGYLFDGDFAIFFPIFRNAAHFIQGNHLVQPGWPGRDSASGWIRQAAGRCGRSGRSSENDGHLGLWQGRGVADFTAAQVWPGGFPPSPQPRWRRQRPARWRWLRPHGCQEPFRRGQRR
jgi:hypothetical protein